MCIDCLIVTTLSTANAMIRNRRSLLVLVSLLANSVFLVCPLAAQISWLGDIKQAQQRASQTKRLILVHFWSDRCNHCLAVERNVFSKPAVARAIQANYVPVKIQVEQNQDLVNQLKVRAWPTDVILAADGREVYHGVSQQDANRFVSQLDQVAALNRYLPTSGNHAIETPRRVSPESALTYQTRTEFDKTRPLSNTARGPQFTSNPLYSTTAPASDSTHTTRGTQTSLAASASGLPKDPQAFVGTRRVATSQSNDPRAAPWKRDPQQLGSTVATSFHTGRTPSQPRTATPVDSHAGQTQVRTPTLGLDGFCPVALSQTQAWKPGNPSWGIIHRERLYLFSSEDAMKRFWSAPDQFSPMLSGFDVVRFFHNGQLAAGHRKHGAWWGQEIYLFAEETSLKQFWSNPAYYSRKVHGLRQARKSQ